MTGMQQLEAPRPVGRPRTRRRHALPALAILQTMITLVGCGPHYRTFTSYTPPATDAGRQCVAQCLNTRHACRSEGDQQVEQCRLDAQREALAENVLRQAGYRMDRRHQSDQTDATPTPPSAVQPNYGRCDRRTGDLAEQCTADFDLCYQNCGGGVAYTTHCVANCD